MSLSQMQIECLSETVSWYSTYLAKQTGTSTQFGLGGMSELGIWPAGKSHELRW